MDERIIELLRGVAETVKPVAAARIASAVVLRGKVISIGICQMKTHPWAVKYQKHEHANYLHAEVDAIYKASKILSPKQFRKATLYVVRVRYDHAEHIRKRHNSGSAMCFGNSKPCAGCSSCIDEFGIQRVVYTIDGTHKTRAYTVEEKFA